MKLIDLTINNFMGIDSATVEFKNGLTLVEGVNHDSSTAQSNGAGKSSVFEALFYALYGQTKRGLKGDEILNARVGKESCVALRFEQGGKRYMIERKRKKGGGTLEFYLGGETAWDALTKGTMKDTQKAIEEIIKISPLAFLKMAFFGQDDVKPFANLTDAELKMVFEQALGLTQFSDALGKLKMHMRTLEMSMIEAEREIERTNTDIRIATEKKAGIEWQIAEADEAKKAETERVKTDLMKFVADYEATKVKLADAEKALAELGEATGTAELEKLQGMFKSLSDKLSEHKSRHAVASNNLISTMKTLNNLHAEAIKVKERIGSACGACGRVFTHEDIDTYLKAIEGNIERYAKDRAEDEGDVAQTEAKVSEIEALHSKFAEKLEAVASGVREHMRQEADLKAKQNELKGNLAALQAWVEKKKQDLEALDTSPRFDKTSHETALKTLNDKINVMRGQVEALGASGAETAKKMHTAKMLAEILGNGGIKSYIFDSITPALNGAINEYMNVLDPDILVDVSTIDKLKSGELKERFAINVDNKNGAGLYDGNSGGERQKINLAIALAFNKLVRSMSEEDVPVLVLDEPFESLDGASSERVVDLLLSLDAASIFLISHNSDLKDMIPHRITVEKKGGKATIREVTA